MRVPTSVRLDQSTIDLIEKEQKRSDRNQTEVIEGTLTLVLNVSPAALHALEKAAEESGKREDRILEECILARLAPGKANPK